MPSTIGPSRSRCLPLLALWVLAETALAAPPHPQAAAVLRYPAKPFQAGERPLPLQVSTSVDGPAYVLDIEFNAPPYGNACGASCANTTLLLDTDGRASTGIQLGGEPETGADLSINVEAIRDFSTPDEAPGLKVRVRALGDPTKPEGKSLAELDSLSSPSVRVTGQTAHIELDPGEWLVPRGPKMRVILHPPGLAAVQGAAPGLPPPGKHKVARVVPVKKGKHHKARAKSGAGEDITTPD